MRNRNINYTNVCTFKCRFCGFSKGPLSLNLRGTPYLLTLEDIQGRVLEATAAGATEVCLQGGIHPDFDGDYYVDVARAVHEVAPDIHIHGFTALEVTEGAKRLGEPLAVSSLHGRGSGDLLDAVVERYETEVGPHNGARVDAIAQRAGVNKQLVYHYFQSKQGLYQSALETVYAEIRERERELSLDALAPDAARALDPVDVLVFTAATNVRKRLVD